MFKLFLFTQVAGRGAWPANQEIIYVTGKWRKHCCRYRDGERLQGLPEPTGLKGSWLVNSHAKIVLFTGAGNH